MTEEYVYDKRRITIVIMIASIIICAGVVIVLMWPAETPPIGDVMTDVIVTTDSDVISSKYTELFGSSLSGDNTTMFKISVYAYNIYYVNRLTVTLEVVEDTFMIGVAVAEMANEANILIGKNNFEGGQTIYTNSLMINQANYVIYIILGTPSIVNFHYNVRVGE